MKLKDGAIQLTHAEGHTTALLTVRGKDHDMSAADLRRLGEACLATAKAVELRFVVAFIVGRAKS